MNWKQFCKDYLTFTKKDRIGLFFIVFVITILLIVPHIITPKHKFKIEEDPLLLAAIDTLQSKRTIDKNEIENSPYTPISENRDKSFTKAKPFTFDPNTLSLEGWRKLGLGERAIKTILNYRNKGGKFFKREDLKKIWGLPQGFYEHVADYISLPSIENRKFESEFDKKNIDLKKEKKSLSIQINNADTTSWKTLPGIGSKLASRIINFREKLGGFYSIEQIGETYGVPDSTFQKIKQFLRSDGNVYRKININTATKEELKSHPYIKWNVANAIVEYRNQHGNYKSLSELKHIVLINESLWNKITPYLSL